MGLRSASARVVMICALTCACRAERAQRVGGVPGAPQAFRDVPIGLCEDHPPESTSEARLREDFRALKLAGVEVLRVSFGWDDLEPERDRYEFAFVDQVLSVAEEYGVRLIPYVCYTPAWLVRSGVDAADVYRSPPSDVGQFEQLMELLASRYAGRFRTWELWNEPDNPAYWQGTAAEYAQLLAAGARGVKRGDANAKVVLGGIAGDLDYLEQLLAEHRVAPSIDIVNLHSYSETWNSEPLEGIPAYLARAAALVRAHGEGEALWLAEVGYGSFRRGTFVSDWSSARFEFEHTPAFQAAALVRVLALARSVPEVALIAWYELRDLPPTAEVIGDHNNRHLGVLEPGGAPKPAFHALTRAVPLLSGPMRALDVRVDAPGATSPVEARAFQRADGRCVIVSWLPTQRLRAGGASVRARFALPLGSAHDTARSLLAFGGTESPLALDTRAPIRTAALSLRPEQTYLLLLEGCR